MRALQTLLRAVEWRAGLSLLWLGHVADQTFELAEKERTEKRICRFRHPPSGISSRNPAKVTGLVFHADHGRFWVAFAARGQGVEHPGYGAID